MAYRSVASGRNCLRTKEDLRDIPFVLLRRRPIDLYLVGPGDILGIVVDKVLGDSEQFVPVKPGESADVPPSLGYPVPIRDDGTISMPQVKPIMVEGLSLAQIEDALKEAYTVKRHIVLPEKFSVIVTLYHKRTNKIIVIRQDSGGNTAVSSNTIFGSTSVQTSPKRGTGQQLDLQIGENDVGTALAKTGGMPGIDAINEVVIEPAPVPLTPEELKASGDEKPTLPSGKPKVKYVNQYIRIPLRLRPGEPFPFTEDDIILQNGDVIFIAARDADVFYTAGLLGGGQFAMPRDTDLDVIQAICLVRGLPQRCFQRQ